MSNFELNKHSAGLLAAASVKGIGPKWNSKIEVNIQDFGHVEDVVFITFLVRVDGRLYSPYGPDIAPNYTLSYRTGAMRGFFAMSVDGSLTGCNVLQLAGVYSALEDGWKPWEKGSTKHLVATAPSHLYRYEDIQGYNFSTGTQKLGLGIEESGKGSLEEQACETYDTHYVNGWITKTDSLPSVTFSDHLKDEEAVAELA